TMPWVAIAWRASGQVPTRVTDARPKRARWAPIAQASAPVPTIVTRGPRELRGFSAVGDVSTRVGAASTGGGGAPAGGGGGGWGVGGGGLWGGGGAPCGRVGETWGWCGVGGRAAWGLC